MVNTVAIERDVQGAAKIGGVVEHAASSDAEELVAYLAVEVKSDLGALKGVVVSEAVDRKHAPIAEAKAMTVMRTRTTTMMTTTIISVCCRVAITIMAVTAVTAVTVGMAVGMAVVGLVAVSHPSPRLVTAMMSTR